MDFKTIKREYCKVQKNRAKRKTVHYCKKIGRVLFPIGIICTVLSFCIDFDRTPLALAFSMIAGSVTLCLIGYGMKKMKMPGRYVSEYLFQSDIEMPKRSRKRIA